MTAPDRTIAPPVNPYRCPDCSAALGFVEGVGSCPRCGYSAAHPLARRVREIDDDLARLGWDRSQLIDRMRRDRSGPPPPPPMTPGPPQPGAPRRSPSVQAILVGLGAFLVVVAGVIFAAVTWEQLGAAGQAAVLVVATATATGVTLVAARAKLTATAEALAVVAAGFAFLDVHAVRTAVAPEGDWQVAWAAGLVVVAAGLIVLGRVAGLRVPAMVAVGAVQLPLVFLASLGDPAGLPIATALVVTAWADLALGRTISGDPPDWLPAPVPVVLRILGASMWVVGVLVSTPWALGIEGASEGWGVGVLVAAAAVATAEAWFARPREPLAVLAAAGAVLSGLLAVLGAGGRVIDDGHTLLLLANASPVAVLAGSLLWSKRFLGERRSETAEVPEPGDEGTDPRVMAGQIVAGGWTAISLLGWIEPVLGSIVAPFALIADEGWWTHGFSVTTGDLDLQALVDQTGEAGWSARLVLAAVAIGTAGLVVAIQLTGRHLPEVRRWATAVAIGIGLFIGVAVTGAFWDVPVVALVVTYLLAAAALVFGPVAPGAPYRPWLAVAVIPIAASAIAWAGTVDVLTVVASGALTIVGGVAVARGLVEERRAWTMAMTAATGIALSATALTTFLAAGAPDQTAWLVAVAVGAAGSCFAWLGDRWKPWWSPAVDVTSAVTVGGALLGLAGAGGTDPFSVGLLIVVVAAAAHATRPLRRAIATTVASVAALVLLWLRLWEADIRFVEAYSLPAAGLAGGAGWWRLRRHSELGSWPTLGPALLIAAIPSTVVAIAETGVLRPLVILGVAVGVTVVGARSRLRAPLVVGALTAVVIAVDLLFPAAARLPRWIGIGAAGIFLLAVGATFERQRRRVVGLFERYRELR